MSGFNVFRVTQAANGGERVLYVVATSIATALLQVTDITSIALLGPAILSKEGGDR